MSTPSNIAEGFGRHHTSEYIHHLRYALASSYELGTQLELALRLGLLRPPEYEKLSLEIDEVGRMLNGLIRSLKNAQSDP